MDEVASVVVPQSTVENAADAALATHAVLDEAAHQEIAQTEDEDYKWLTDRLDALYAEQTQLRTLYTSKVETLEAMLRSTQESAAQQIQSLTSLLNTMSTNLANLSATALVSASSQLTQNESTTTSTTQPETETVAIVEPVQESADRTPAETVKQKKRYRI